jgi:hypothetical protein
VVRRTPGSSVEAGSAAVYPLDFRCHGPSDFGIVRVLQPSEFDTFTRSVSLLLLIQNQKTGKK